MPDIEKLLDATGDWRDTVAECLERLKTGKRPSPKMDQSFGHWVAAVICDGYPELDHDEAYSDYLYLKENSLLRRGKLITSEVVSGKLPKLWLERLREYNEDRYREGPKPPTPPRDRGVEGRYRCLECGYKGDNFPRPKANPDMIVCPQCLGEGVPNEEGDEEGDEPAVEPERPAITSEPSQEVLKGSDMPEGLKPKMCPNCFERGNDKGEEIYRGKTAWHYGSCPIWQLEQDPERTTEDEPPPERPFGSDPTPPSQRKPVVPPPADVCGKCGYIKCQCEKIAEAQAAKRKPEPAPEPIVDTTPVDPEAVLWRKGSGDLITLESMDNGHLVNAYRICLKKAADDEQDEFQDRRIIPAIEAEAGRREMDLAYELSIYVWSQYSLGMNIKCGQQRYYRYEMGIKGRPKFATIAGSSSDAAATMNLTHKMHTKELLPLADVKDKAATDFDERIEKAAGEFWLAPDQKNVGVKKIAGAAKDVAVQFAGLHHGKLAPAIDPYEVQGRFEIRIEGQDFAIMGYKDVVEEVPDAPNLRRVRDLKSGKKAYSRNDANGDLQLTVYALDERIKTGVTPEVGFDVLQRPRGKSGEMKAYHVGSTRSDQDCKNLLNVAKAATDGVRAGIVYPARFLPGAWWCSENWCFYWGMCPFGARMGTKQD